MQNRITKLKSCPECGAATDGKSCRCGWERVGLKKTNRNISSCKLCNMPGDHGGLCKLHWEQMVEKQYITRLESYRDDKNNLEIDILVGKISAKELIQRKEQDNQNKQEENDDDIPF